jgi:flagellar basal-body rod modification protein FlgD
MSPTAAPSAFAGQPASTGTTPDANSRIANQDTFLKLLVAQISHQNPLQPADGVEFLSQLTQFTSVEQQLAMRKELEAIRGLLTAAQSTDPASASLATQNGNRS